MVPYHRHAGGRRRTDDFIIGKRINEFPHQRNCFLLVSGVVMHLAAAGLFRTKNDVVAQALQYSDHSNSGLGKQKVVIARDKQRYSHSSKGNGVRAAVLKY